MVDSSTRNLARRMCGPCAMPHKLLCMFFKCQPSSASAVHERQHVFYESVARQSSNWLKPTDLQTELESQARSRKLVNRLADCKTNLFHELVSLRPFKRLNRRLYVTSPI